MECTNKSSSLAFIYDERIAKITCINLPTSLSSNSIFLLVIHMYKHKDKRIK